MSRPAGRPSHEEGPLISRAEILNVAARVIGKYGYEGATLRRIANEAGVSYGTLQYHFHTKDLIWKALVHEVILPAWESAFDATPDQLKTKVSEFVHTRIEITVLRPGLTGAVLIAQSPAGQDRLRFLAEATSALRKKDRQMLVKLRDQGVLRDVDVDAVQVVAVIGLACVSSAKLAIRHLIGLDLDDESNRLKLVEGITDLLLYGLLPR